MSSTNVTLSVQELYGTLTLSELEEFISRFELQDNGCLVWTKQTYNGGYGVTSIRGVLGRTHRLMYSLVMGPISDDLVLDHLCLNKACANPAHLEPVSNTTNILRGTSPSAQNARRTECVNGHRFNRKNTGQGLNIGGRPRRYCRECKRIREAARRTKLMARSAGEE